MSKNWNKYSSIRQEWFPFFREFHNPGLEGFFSNQYSGFITAAGQITDATDAMLFLHLLMKNFLNGDGIIHILGVKVK